MDARAVFGFLLGCLIGGGIVFGIQQQRAAAPAAVKEKAVKEKVVTAPVETGRTIERTVPEDDEPPVAAADAVTGSEPVVVADAPVVESLPVEPPEPSAVERRVLAKLASAASNLEFLESIDLANLDAGGARTHKAYLAAMRRREALRLAVSETRVAGENVSEADAVALRQSEAAVNELAAAERHVLFAAAARAMGYEGEAAERFALTLWSVVSATDGK